MRDDEDDSMAANPEPDLDEVTRARMKRILTTPAENPHSAAGYVDTTAPRSRKPKGEKAGRWEIVFVEGKQADEVSVPVKHCRDCREPAAILHSVHPEIRREYCGACAGKINRARIEGRA